MGTHGWAYRRRQPEGTVLYEAVRENLATLLAEASEVGRGLLRYVERDFARYLECGVLAHGFARVRCESCKDELLVAFSCKGRGVCPSCSAKRAHVTAMHLVEQVLPHVPFRQWTLSFPHRVRWVLLKDVGLLSDVLTVFLRAVFALQRRRARRQGLRGGQAGDVQPLLQRHFHAEPLPQPLQGGHIDASGMRSDTDDGDFHGPGLLPRGRAADARSPAGPRARRRECPAESVRRLVGTTRRARGV